ncbi:unnamed protein product, partial [Closterium sp. NIES-54]
SWKGKAVKAAMDEEIRSLISNGTWELVERPHGVNVMKNRWVLMTKYHVDDTVAREKARLVVKGFTQVYGADYNETYALVGSYVTLRIVLSIVASPLLWYSALDAVLTGAGWSKSQVDEALYFGVGVDGVACWVLVYVDDLLATSNNTAMLKELLEAAFELREISPVEKRFIDEEQTGRRLKTPVFVDAYAELTFDDEEFQSREEEEYRHKVCSLQIAATTTRPDIAFACSKLGSGLTLLNAGTPTALNVDNQSAISVAEGLGLKGNLKHMERRYVWLQQMVKRKKIALEYIPTSEQPADFLTKALHFLAFNWCSVAVGQVRLAEIGDDDDDVQQ